MYGWRKMDLALIAVLNVGAPFLLFGNSLSVDESLGIISGLTLTAQLVRALARKGNIERFLETCGFTLAGSLFWTAVVILFGAPMTELVLRTMLLGVLQSCLTFYYVSEAKDTRHDRLSAAERIIFREYPKDVEERKVWGGCYGVCVGAWLGALPIPLDWDQPWQAWPITVYYGSIVGWSVGRLAGPFAFNLIVRREE